MRMNKVKSIMNIPNMITFMALFLSWTGIIFLLNDKFYVSFSLILVAFVLDAVDGYLARRLGQESDFGRQLDGHVDVFVYLLYPALSYYYFFGLRDAVSFLVIFTYMAFGIFRLVRFNGDVISARATDP